MFFFPLMVIFPSACSRFFLESGIPILY
jgi:hypothetical protein